MRVLIVDDESAARRRLAALIEDIDRTGIEIVGEAGDGLTAISLVRDRRPDLVLLDIAMREVDGFDVVRHLPNPRPLIIFQTAHHHFALQAFDYDALDYVVKPVRRERLAEAIERARRRLATAVPAAMLDPAALARVGAAFGYASAAPERLLVRHGAGHRLVPVADIHRFEADEGGVYAYVDNTRTLTDYSLAELEDRVRCLFIRTSRADLVSLAAVDTFTSNGDGSLTLTLRTPPALRVSRRRAAEVKTRLSGGEWRAGKTSS